MAGEDLARLAAAAIAIYAFGHVSGSLLVRQPARDALCWTMVRLVAGLLLTAIAFLLSLLLGIPWFIGPAVTLVVAVVRGRAAALAIPRPPTFPRGDDVAAFVVGAAILAPIVVSAALMAPGEFPPVFFNVDTPYFLEQVHALVAAADYPAPSLSNAGGARTYHYGTHAVAAWLSRTTGLAPHQAVFVFLLPLLAGGVLAAAFAAARALAPMLPASLAVPALLVAVPSFWYSFLDVVGPRLWQAVTAGEMAALQAVVEDYETWGAASIVGQNLGAHFVVLAVLAGVAAAPARGWRLPVFLAGTAIIVKVSAGIALLAGLLLAEGWRVLSTRRLDRLPPVAGVMVVFLATYVAFWVAPPLPADFSTEIFPLFHLSRMAERDTLAFLPLDLAWLFLPVAVVALGRVRPPAADSLPLLLFGLAPLIVVNVTRSIDARPGGGGATDDWLQILLTTPYVLHAFVLAFASARWHGLRPAIRAAFAGLMVLTFLPAAYVSARYAGVLLRDPQAGHEYADNRAIGEALARIPVRGAMVVTNDLRYPAQRYNRDNRQLQIPALFGHQAFAVNYAYEVFEFSRERRELQPLLQSEAWSGAIDQVAASHGWTHLLIHKDYPHPAAIPLERLFENASYAVYRFPK